MREKKGWVNLIKKLVGGEGFDRTNKEDVNAHEDFMVEDEDFSVSKVVEGINWDSPCPNIVILEKEEERMNKPWRNTFIIKLRLVEK